MTQGVTMRSVAIAAILFGIFFNSAQAATALVKRYAVIAAANNGGAQRTPLRYAETDALTVAKVLQDLGGLENTDRLLLLDPSPEELLGAMSQMRQRLLREKKDFKRTEIIFYYSGHSDEQGLLLGERRLDYAQLKNALTTLPADVQIAILDSCASGAFTRIKGGKQKPPFMVDESSDVSGYAFLTSSSSTENAQESDAINGSYFTHYFVSALRGAGDTTQDKKVTLNEAYQYAFHETLARTEQTMSGAQHAAYDFKLAGAGDLVLTDLSSAASRIHLEKELGGRLYVRDQTGRLIVELNKIAGIEMEVSLPPQSYLVTLDKQGTLYRAAFTVASSTSYALNFGQFHSVDPETTVARGNADTGMRRVNNENATVEGDIDIEQLIDDVLQVHTTEYNQVPIRLSILPGLSFPAKTDKGKKDFVDIDLELLGSTSDSAKIAAAYFVSTIQEDVIGGQGAGAVSFVGRNLYGGQGAGIASVTRGNVTGGQGAGIVSAAFGNLRGGQGAGIVSMIGGKVKGGQGAGIAAVAGENVEGGQGAGIATFVKGDLNGFQAAGITTFTLGASNGVQIAGIGNTTMGDMRGAQIAIIGNAAFGSARGAQIGVIGNATFGNFDGIQIAGIMNITGGTNNGVQLGMINVAEHASKLQLGMFNAAKKNDNLAIGFVNFIGNGRFDVGMSYDESAYSSIFIKSGAQHIYNYVALGQKRDIEDTFTRMRWGIGFSTPLSTRLALDNEFVVSSRFQGGDDLFHCTVCAHYSNTFSLGSNINYTLIDHLRVFAGININVPIRHASDKSNPERVFGKDTTSLWPGLTIGAMY